MAHGAHGAPGSPPGNGESVAEIMRVPPSKRLLDVRCSCRIHAYVQRVRTPSGSTPMVTPQPSPSGASSAGGDTVPIVVLGGGRVLIAKNADDGRTVGRVELESDVLSLIGVGDVVWVGDIDGGVSRFHVELQGDGAGESGHSARGGLVRLDESTEGHSAGVHLMAVSTESLISASQDGCVVEWPLDNIFMPQQVIPPSDTVITALTSSASSVIVATQTLIKSIDTVSGTILTFSPHDAPVTCLSLLFSSQLWSCSSDGVVCITSLKDSSLLHRFSLLSPVASITLVGCQVWLWSEDGTLRLVDPVSFEVTEHAPQLRSASGRYASTPRSERSGPPVGVIEVAEADIRRVWTPYDDGSIGVWDVRGTSMTSMYNVVCEGLSQATAAAAAAAADKPPADATRQPSQDPEREKASELEGQIVLEKRRVSELEETVKGLVAHCSEMQEKVGEVDRVREEFRVSYEHSEELEKDCGHLSKELEAAMAELHSKDKQIHILSHSLADLEGIEEDAVSQQMLLEDLQRDVVLSKEAQGRSDINSDHETAHAHYLSLFWSHLCRMHSEDIRRTRVVNNALKLHIDNSKHQS